MDSTTFLVLETSMHVDDMGDAGTIIFSTLNHAEAHTFATQRAEVRVGHPIIVRLFQEVGVYSAEVKVTMRKPGE